MQEAAKAARSSDMGNRQVFILQGVSGAGKSTLAQQLVAGLRVGQGVIVSADDFFLHPETRTYKFDPSLLGEAHGACIRSFVAAVAEHPKSDVVVVDNTNTSLGEVAPYYAVAEAFGYEVTILVVGTDTDVLTCHARNVHGVPVGGVIGQGDRIASFGESMPPWWTRQTVEAFKGQGGFERLDAFKKED
jgi:predicted ABC-type ATPase